MSGASALLLAAGPVMAQTAASDAHGDDETLQVPGIDVTAGKEAPAPDAATDIPEAPEDSAANGYRGRTAGLTPFGKVSVKDLPYSINTTSGELMENRDAHSLGDALQTNPTASLLMSSAGYSSMTRMMIRGFTAADQSEMRDGLVDRSFSYPPIENVERIEVLNGFSGFFQGFSSPGGSINYVSKAPTNSLLATATTGTYGGGINFGQADLGGPVPATDGRLRYRLNAYREDGTTYIDGSRQKRALLSGVADYHFAPDTVLTADIWHQDYTQRGLQTYFSNTSGGTWNSAAFGVPKASSFDATKQYGQDWTYNDAEKTLEGLRFQSKLSDVFTLRTGYRHGDMWRQYQYVGAQLLDTAGDYKETLTASPRQYERTDSAYGLVDAEFSTWGVKHTLTAGYTGTYFYYERGADVTTVLGTSSTSSPLVTSDPGLALGDSNTWQNIHYNNTLIGDRVELTDQWSVLAGLNHAGLHQRGWGTGTNISTANYDTTKNTPSFGVVFKPIPNISTYASYMQGLVAGDSTSSASAKNRYEILSPSVSEQYETGVKTTFGRMDLNAALFRIDKVNAELDPNDLVYKHDGREIHQGLEVTATGRLTDQLTAVGGFTLMDAYVDKATADPLSEGKTPINVPQQQASAYLEYAVPRVPHLSVTGGANYIGRRPVDAHNTAYLDGATVFNAGVRYEPEIYGHKTSFNLNVQNLFDTSYWTYFRNGDGLLQGAPRVVAFSVKATW